MIRTATLGGAILGLAVAGCHAQLEPVRVAGAMGQGLSAHEASVSAIASACLEVATLAGASDECGDVRARSRSWARVVALLGAYGGGLRSPAHAAPSDAADDDWPGLSPPQAGAARTLAGALRTMIEQSPGDGDLRDLAAGADGAVQELARGLDDLVGRELARLDLARSAIDVVRGRLQEMAAAAPATRRAPAPGASAAPAGPASPAPARAPDKTSTMVAAEVAPVREGVAALRTQLDQTLSERASDRAADRQTAVPGSLAQLGLLLGDLETKRAHLERVRDAVDAFARVHKALHDDPGGGRAALVRAASHPAAPAAPGPAAR